MSDYFSHDNLLKPPVKRAAFSDRTAYLMAEMARLAYFRFEGGTNLDEILKMAADFIPEKEKFAMLENLIKNTVITNSSVEAENILREILAQKWFELVSTFNDVSTDAQGFLCKQTEQKMAILVFRGTEKTLKDIKTDVKATLKTVEYGDDKSVKIHSGYHEQFISLENEIKATLASDDLRDHQLFITGHSLGGALAITATKFLASDSTGACYTFGSPPVGTNKFDEDIKTPIYRIINYVDIVPRLPNPYVVGLLQLSGWGMEFILSPLGKIYNRITDTGLYKKLEKLLIDAGQYRQSGYGSYLVGKSKNVKLRYNVMFYDKVKWWLYQCKNLFRGDSEIIADHSIELYSQLLAIWAVERTKEK
jgi:triacylglycerol lipase